MIDPVRNLMGLAMTFELVRYGWPNAMVILTLAAIPFVSLGLSSEQGATPEQVHIMHSDHGTMTVGNASLAE